MKKVVYFLLTTSLFYSCKNDKNLEPANSQTPTDSVQVDTETTSLTSKAFEINDIPISTADLGDFPFFTAPKDAKYINNIKPKDFDFIVFVTPESIFEVEGKTFRSWIHPERDKEISGRYIFKSYDDAILKAGGVKVFEGKLADDRLKQYNELFTYIGSDGSFTPSGNSAIVCYVINHVSGPIYIALEKKDFPSSSIQIVQQAAFKQTIEKITSDKIVEDLTKAGKSILYINFDVDKSTLTNDGAELVNEIADALKKDTTLKISVEGHTDNTGDGTHNKKLSTQRAEAVVTALVGKGITKDRLVAKGLGAENPLVANDSDENKAKNRRVELVKM